MKTSFYFFIWIIIYPLLSLIHSQWIYQNSFLVALFIVWGLSYLINRNMPDTIRYERVAQVSSILEEVYSGNVTAFRRRLARRVTIDFITALYFGITFVFILFSMVRGSADDWIALLIFGFFGFGAISRAFKLNQAYTQLKRNPTREECVVVVERAYQMDYAAYYSERQHRDAVEMLPPMPRHFRSFQVVSLIIAVLCALLGLYNLIMAIVMLAFSRNPQGLSAGIMYFLYGSLAVYFGIKDSLASFAYFKKPTPLHK